MRMPQALGDRGKELPRAACFEFVEVLRVSLSPLYTPWFSSLGHGCEMQGTAHAEAVLES